MKRTTFYLDATHVERLRRIASREGRSHAEIVRRALAEYEVRLQRDRNLALAGAWEGDGTSIADRSEEELLRGFGAVNSGLPLGAQVREPESALN